MLFISGSKHFADGPPLPQHTSSGIHGDGTYKVCSYPGGLCCVFELVKQLLF
jgi:hypothetical protein